MILGLCMSGGDAIITTMEVVEKFNTFFEQMGKTIDQINMDSIFDGITTKQ
jgi:hypothetical protein